MPVLPKPMLEVLQAPTPYILGVHSHWLRDLLNQGGGGALEDVVLVDIDRGCLDFSLCTPPPNPTDVSQLNTLGVSPPPLPPRTTTLAPPGMFPSPTLLVPAPLPAPSAGPPPLPPSVHVPLLNALRKFLSRHGGGNDGSGGAHDITDSSNNDSSQGAVESAPISKATSPLSPLLGEKVGEGARQAVGVGPLTELRLLFAAHLASLFKGFGRCIFWVDTEWPVFDAARFLGEFARPKDVDSLRAIVASQVRFRCCFSLIAS